MIVLIFGVIVTIFGLVTDSPEHRIMGNIWMVGSIIIHSLK